MTRVVVQHIQNSNKLDVKEKLRDIIITVLVAIMMMNMVMVMMIKQATFIELK